MTEATKGFRRLEVHGQLSVLVRLFEPAAPDSALQRSRRPRNVQPGSAVPAKFDTRRDIVPAGTLIPRTGVVEVHGGLNRKLSARSRIRIPSIYGLSFRLLRQNREPAGRTHVP